jgi:uncharacterized membrane protein
MRRTRLTRLDTRQLHAKLAALRARRSRLHQQDVAERRHLRRAEDRILTELEQRDYNARQA